LVGQRLEATFKNLSNKSITSEYGSSKQSLILWAIACSILIHILLVLILPNIQFEPAKKTDILTVEIQPEAPPAPVVEKELVAEPTPPEPIKKIIEPKPKEKPITKTIETPSPIQEAATPQPEVSNPPPNVIAVAPTENITPLQTVSPPVTAQPKPVEHSEADVDNALGEYGGMLGRAIAKHKQYPKIAQMRGWQGEVKLDLKLDGSGKVISATVSESSGYEALDKQALEMVRKAAPFPLPPEALRNRTFNINVPVSFKLE
jgi:protein TonB